MEDEELIWFGAGGQCGLVGVVAMCMVEWRRGD